MYCSAFIDYKGLGFTIFSLSMLLYIEAVFIIAFNKYFSNLCSEASGTKCSQRTRGFHNWPPLCPFTTPYFFMPYIHTRKWQSDKMSSRFPWQRTSTISTWTAYMTEGVSLSPYMNMWWVHIGKYESPWLGMAWRPAIYENVHMSLKPYLKIRVALSVAAFHSTLK